MRKPCRECGGRDVIRYSFADGDGTRVIVECRHCECRRFDSSASPTTRRDEIVQARRDGESVTSLSLRFNVSRQAIYNVLHAAEADGTVVPWSRRERQPHSCVICGDRVRSERSPYRKTCSRECLQKLRAASPRPLAENTKWSRRKILSLVCSHCGKTFERTEFLQTITSRGRDGKRNFCSTGCNLADIHSRRRHSCTP